MILSLIVLLGLACPEVVAFASARSRVRNGRPSVSSELAESKVDLEKLAAELNPLLKFYDPLGMVDTGFWGFSQERTIGWLRESEIKHGRVAMAAFVGYCVQSNFVFPWSLTNDGMPHPSTELSPPEQFDALPLASKVQIILFVGFLEWFSELDGIRDPHYTKGGKPGYFPPLKGNLPHPVPFNLFDPFDWSKNRSEEAKARGLRAEINNGRLAMIGIIGFLSEQKIAGSVPILTGVVKPYSGEVMAPFEADFTLSDLF